MQEHEYDEKWNAYPPHYRARACRGQIDASALVLRTLCFAVFFLSTIVFAQTPGTPAGLIPIFPPETGTATVEGEEAINTNWNIQSTFVYGASGNKALQLSKTKTVGGTDLYYADFTITVPANGNYDLWLAGTPPGSKDQSGASYASPLRIQIDGQVTSTLYAENVAIKGCYTPGYYLIKGPVFVLTPGSHSVRITVPEPRRYDDRFVAYLDAFSFVTSQTFPPANDTESALLATIRSLRGKPSIPQTFLEEQLIALKKAPGDISLLLNLIRTYSLASDNLNAIKFANRALTIDPASSDALLLLAKNQLWNGNITEGLETYWKLLARIPENKSAWLEAGKVAAWFSRYDVSESFYRGALNAFPEDTEVLINLGLTYQWWAQGSQAQDLFARAQATAEKSPQTLSTLINILEQNDNHELAFKVCERALTLYPDHLIFFGQKAKILLSLDRRKEANGLPELVRQKFLQSSDLENWITAFLSELFQRNQVIDRYLTSLESSPENSATRLELSQAYLWNGQKNDSLGEYGKYMATLSYQALFNMATQWKDLFGFVLRSENQQQSLSAQLPLLKAETDALQAELTRYNQSRQNQAPATEDINAAEFSLRAKIAATKLWIEKLQSVPQQWQSQLESVGSSLASIEKANTGFEALSSNSGWTFRRSIYENELQAAFGNKLQIADSALLLIDILDRNGQKAKARAERMTGGQNDRPSDWYLQTLAGLWWSPSAENASLQKVKEWQGEALPDNWPLLQLQVLLQDRDSIQALKPIDSSVPPSAPSSETQSDLTADFKALQEARQDLEKSLSTARNQLAASQNQIWKSMSANVALTLYNLQGATLSQRTSLGSLYLQTEQTDQAIRQFLLVTDFDSLDLNARLQLAGAHLKQGDWFSALGQYRTIYKNDKTFGNAAGLFNIISRQHPDIASAGIEYFSDKENVSLKTGLTVEHRLGPVAGINLGYENLNVRQSRTFIDSPHPLSVLTRTVYDVNSLKIGVPLYSESEGIRITPELGVLLNANGLYLKQDSTGLQSTSILSLEDNFQNFELGAWAKLGFHLTKGYFDLDTTYRYGAFYPALAPPRRLSVPTNQYSHEAEADINMNFLNADIPFIQNLTTRIYTKVSVVPDSSPDLSAAIVLHSDEIRYYFVHSGSPYTNFYLQGNFLYQNTLALDGSNEVPAITKYFAPNSVDSTLIGGGFGFGSWFALGSGNVLGFYTQATAGAFAFKTGNFRIEALGGLELTLGTVLGQLSGSWQGFFSPVNAAQDIGMEYWNFSIKLSLKIGLPEILAP